MIGSTRYGWPSREEWAEERRTPYYDRLEDLGVSERLADYGSETEINVAIQALKGRWRELGRQMRTAGKGPPSWNYETLRADRQDINTAIKEMGEGKLPWRHPKYSADILSPFSTRYDAARRTAEDQRQREIAATPIDDAAWEAELHRRERIDDYLGNPVRIKRAAS